MRTHHPSIQARLPADGDEPPPVRERTQPAVPGRLLGAADVAQVLGVPATFVYALARRGELPTVTHRRALCPLPPRGARAVDRGAGVHRAERHQVSTPPKWGPSHQHSPAGRAEAASSLGVALVAALVVLLLVPADARGGDPGDPGRVDASGGPSIGCRASTVGRRRAAAAALTRCARCSSTARRLGGGIYLGWATTVGGCARGRRAGGAACSGRRGRARPAAVMIPALLAHPGPAVCASTKPDVLAATASARLATWDGCGSLIPPASARRWLGSAAALVAGHCAGSWDGALLMARAMVAAPGRARARPIGRTGQSARSALLAPLLHAAALSAAGHRRRSPTGCSATSSTSRRTLLERCRALLGRRGAGRAWRTPRRGSAPRSSPPPPTRSTPTAPTGALAGGPRPELRRRAVRALKRHDLHPRARRAPGARRAAGVRAAVGDPRARPTTPTATAQLPARVLFALG